MNAFLYGLKKEFIEIIRTKKLIALSAVALFFSLLDPVMLKLTPYLVEQFSGVDLGDMLQLSQIAGLIDFHQDIYQIYTIVFVIIVCGAWINEIKHGTIEIPMSKGVKPSVMLLSKITAYSLLVIGIMVLVYSINYYYAGIIFGFRIDYYQVLMSALIMGLFYAWCMTFVLTLSILLMNSLAAIFVTLLTVFGGPFLASLLKIDIYTPYGLLSQAQSFSRVLPRTIVLNCACVLALTAALYYIAAAVAEKKEVVKYR